MEMTQDDAREMIGEIFSAYDMPAQNSDILCDLVLKAETEGSRSHGLLRVPDYIASMSTGWLDCTAIPSLVDESPTALVYDCHNGFTQVAAVLARDALERKAREQGMAMLNVRNGHHIGALWCDIEPLALKGLVLLNFVNSRCRMAPYGSHRKLLGTNAMAFSAPDGQGGAITWDQASSGMSLGEVKLFSIQGRQLPEGVGIDANGDPTTEPSAVLKGGAVLPFSGHKGSSIALMVEITAAGLGGGNFGFEDDSPAFPGAASSNAGQCIIAIDPAKTAGAAFPARMAALREHMTAEPFVKLPGERRNALRQQPRASVQLSDAEYAILRDCLKAARQRKSGA